MKTIITTTCRHTNTHKHHTSAEYANGYKVLISYLPAGGKKFSRRLAPSELPGLKAPGTKPLICYRASISLKGVSSQKWRASAEARDANIKEG